VHEGSTTRNHGDLITLGVYSLVQHFRRTEGHRVDITPAEWDEFDRFWSECRNSIARRLSRRGDYYEARRLFVDVARGPGTLKQRSIAWLGALAAVCRREPSYKAEYAVGWLMRPWSRGCSGPDAGRQ
jgi:hypothetical protein